MEATDATSSGVQPLALARQFLVIGLISFGGQRQAYLYDAFVRRLRWMTDDDYLEGLALSQALPGPNFMNVAAYCGTRLGGVGSGLLGAVLVAVPGAIFISLLTAFFVRFIADPHVAGALHGVTIGAAALLAVTLYRLARRGLRLPLDVVVAVAALALSVVGVPLVVILVVLGGANLWRHRPRRA
ncbi:MAG: chromate transporter [Chloroflexota bacterium]|nr:chromate transporter [Chloroflexota bacterium]MDE3101842.1 chromate transporter [Chloroflexota bacterium]